VNPGRTLELIRQGSQQIRFADFLRLVEAFGFRHDRTHGSHLIFVRPGSPRPLSLQPLNGRAKFYQVRQFLKLADDLGLQLEDFP
jgi:hypothetical protein